jgi:hypothetical protein
MKKAHHSLREFLQDARGNFNAFTLIALVAGVTLATAPGICRMKGWPPLNRDEIGALSLVYCISALGDYLLAIFLNKMPSTLIQTDGGAASLTTDGDANATSAPSPDAPAPPATPEAGH